MPSLLSINACYQKDKVFSYVFNVLQNLLMKSCHISAELRPESKPSEVAFSVALVGNSSLLNTILVQYCVMGNHYSSVLTNT